MFNPISIVVMFLVIFSFKTISTDPILQSAKNATNKLQVAIYYESLGPDSVNFITEQFEHEYEKFKNFIDVLFVPFGKSESEKNGQVFYCNHGPLECIGNRIQSCVLDALNNDQDSQVKFVTCQMKRNAEYSGKKCAESVNVRYEILQNCTTGQKGVELQLKDEQQTHRIAKPYPSFIPTIVYNGVYNNKKQWQSICEFKKILCNELLLTATSAELENKCP